MQHDKIAVIDFGGQYAHLIATKLRHIGVLAELRDGAEGALALAEYRGVILSGSPSMASMGEGTDYDPEILNLPVPILGLCFGHQEMARFYGGKVKFVRREYGPATLHLVAKSPLFEGMDPEQVVWMSHGDSVVELPDGFVEVGYTLHEGEHRGPNAAVANEALKRYGLQFHPEVDDTPGGDVMLRNFALSICGCRTTWSMKEYVAQAVDRIRDDAGGRQVLLLVSGGVDSTVCAWLLSRAVGPDRLHLLHIDNGLMRAGESQWVIDGFKQFDVSRKLHFSDAGEQFVGALAGITDPEVKRRIIGETFIKVLEEEARKLDLEHFVMAQGTIYPDTIETGGTKRSAVIKTHHNRVLLAQEMIRKGRMLEPIKELYKAEVRELGQQLGVPEELVNRHPFPGPGLGVRLLAGTGERPEGLTDELNRQVHDIASGFGLSSAVLPIRSVGVKGDLRSYELPVALWGNGFPWETAAEAATTIVNRIPGVNRCVLLWGQRFKEKFKPVRAYTTHQRLELLRHADKVVNEALETHQLLVSIWQCPVIMVPIKAASAGEELVVIRPVHSERAMTAQPAKLPAEMLRHVAAEVVGRSGVWGLGLDVTAKPPGTIEWE